MCGGVKRGDKRMGACCWYLRGGMWRSRRRDILGACLGFVFVF